MSRFWSEADYRIVIANTHAMKSIEIWELYFADKSKRYVYQLCNRITFLRCIGKSDEQVLAALVKYRKSIVWTKEVDAMLQSSYDSCDNFQLSKMLYNQFGISRTSEQIAKRLHHLKLVRNTKPVKYKDEYDEYPKTFAEKVLDRHWAGEKFQQGSPEYQVAKKYNFISY